jgi:hypothetical protein
VLNTELLPALPSPLVPAPPAPIVMV